MQLKVKDLDITTGGNLIAILNENDAKRLDLRALDRVKVTYRNKTETVMINISESSKIINKGQVGLVEDVIKSLKVKDGNNVEVKIARKPLSLVHIKKKLDGYVLTKKEIDQIVWDIVHNKLSDIEITYFVSACYTKSMSQNETVLLTKAIVSNGEQLRLGRYPIADKHCIGGIPGNRTTMIIVPIIASAGFTIPKTSSRSITSPAGTADTMEVLADVSFSIKEMRRILKRVNGCIVWGGALNLAPADDKIINVERPLGIDAESQLIASIMAKKLSVNSTHIIIDIPTGENSKIDDICSAFCLKRRFEYIGRLLKRKIKVVITDGSEPIGNGIGPALEARDILYILMRSDKRPLDLEKKSLMMAGHLLSMLGLRNGYKMAKKILESGLAYKKMRDIIRMQRGNPYIKPEDIKIGKHNFSFRVKKPGIIGCINNYSISKIARIAGAPVDKGAGVYLHKHVGENVNKGDILFTLYSESKEKLSYAEEILNEIEVVSVK